MSITSFKVHRTGDKGNVISWPNTKRPRSRLLILFVSSAIPSFPKLHFNPTVYRKHTRSQFIVHVRKAIFLFFNKDSGGHFCHTIQGLYLLSAIFCPTISSFTPLVSRHRKKPNAIRSKCYSPSLIINSTQEITVNSRMGNTVKVSTSYYCFI